MSGEQQSAELSLAEQVLDVVGAEGGSGVEAEVLVTRTDLAVTRFATSFVHQNVADATTTVRLRLHLDGRTAGSATTITSRDGLREFVARTLAGARLLPPDPGWPGLAPSAPANGMGTLDEGTATATPAERAERVRAFVDAAGGLETAGFCRTRTTWAAFANSAGQLLAGATSDAAMDGIARARGGAGDPPSDGVARAASPRLADLDGGVLGGRAAAKARAGIDPVEIPPGIYSVVLEPTASADLVFMLAVDGFNGRALTDGTSFARIGAAQFDPSVSMVDDATAQGAIGLPFDADGTPKQRLELVREGTTAAVAHDRRTAAQAGSTSTGHGIGAASFGAFPANLTLLPAGRRLDGGGGPDGSVHEVEGPVADSGVAALVAQVERGLLVSDIWYTRVLDPRTLVVTGLTRNGVWLIERGELTRPVSTLRFTQSYPAALAPGLVAGIGPNAPHVAGEDWIESDLRAPALSLASWNVTGGASG
jgi:predicted Zn-dependent protease